MTRDDHTPNTQKPPSATDDVAAAHARWWDANLNGDVVALDTLLADDLTLHDPFGGIGTKAEDLEKLRSGKLKYQSITYEAPLTRLHGETAIVTGPADIQFAWEGQQALVKVNYTAVYGWTSPHWRMLAWQSTIRGDAQS
jgi:ketosteroid isomerase-like protein